MNTTGFQIVMAVDLELFNFPFCFEIVLIVISRPIGVRLWFQIDLRNSGDKRMLPLERQKV